MSSTRQALLDAFQQRFTCKRYDPAAHVDDEDFDAILEVARLSPSSFGMEPWKLLVVENPDLLGRVLACSPGAKKNADRTVIVLARKDLNATCAYTEHILGDVQHKSEQDKEIIRSMFAYLVRSDQSEAEKQRMMFDWTCRQSYILLGDMLCAAALLGVDSTPVEGFIPAQLNALLADEGIIDPEEFAVSVIVQFGKADASHCEHPKLRRPAEEVIARV